VEEKEGGKHAGQSSQRYSAGLERIPNEERNSAEEDGEPVGPLQSAETAGMGAGGKGRISSRSP
jgi:hypothetical protein